MFAIGIYVGDIIPQSFPASILLKLYLHYFAPQLGSRELNFILELDGEEAARIEGSIRQDSLDTPIALSLPAVTLSVDKPAQLDVYAVTGDQRELIVSRRILATT